MGFGKITDTEKADAEKEWNSVVFPSFQHLNKQLEGPLLGGSKPSIADLAFLGYLAMLYGKCPDSFAAKNAELKAYFEALKAALPKYKEYMSAAESFWK